MFHLDLTPNKPLFSAKDIAFAQILKKLKSNQLFSFTMLLALDFDISVLFIVIALVGVITFLAGTAYGIYLNDKISAKDTSNQLSGS